MQKQRAFTIIELLVVISIIAVLIGLLFPAIGAIKRNARQKENDLKVRGLIQGMINYSASHRDFFPGFDGFAFTANTVDTTGNSGPGQFAEARYWILLDGNFTTSDQLISPAEEKELWREDEVTTDNYSYCMLKIAGGTNMAPLSAANKKDAYRREEWRNQQNPLAPLMFDRLVIEDQIIPEPGQPQTYLSIHDGSTEGNWMGSIGRGDLSVDFTTEPEIETRFASFRNDEDDIYSQYDGSGAGVDADKNAAGTYRGADQPRGERD